MTTTCAKCTARCRYSNCSTIPTSSSSTRSPDQLLFREQDLTFADSFLPQSFYYVCWAYYAVCICGAIKRSSVRPSVRPSVRMSRRSPAAARLAGLLLRSGAGSRYRSIAAAAVRHAARVNFSPTVSRSVILVLQFTIKRYRDPSVCLSRGAAA